MFVLRRPRTQIALNKCSPFPLPRQPLELSSENVDSVQNSLTLKLPKNDSNEHNN